MDLKDTISGFQGIMGGKYDDLPEMAFYMVGDIKEVQVRQRPISVTHLESNAGQLESERLANGGFMQASAAGSGSAGTMNVSYGRDLAHSVHDVAVKGILVRLPASDILLLGDCWCHKQGGDKT